MENYILRIADKHMQGHQIEGNDLDRAIAIKRLDSELDLYKFFDNVEALPVYSFLRDRSGEGGCQSRLYYCEKKDKKLDEQELKAIKDTADEKDRIVSVFRLEEII